MYVVMVIIPLDGRTIGEMTALSNMVSSEVNSVILSSKTRNCKTCQDDRFPDPDNRDHPDHITVWPAKVMNGLTPNFTCMLFGARHTIYMLGILRSIYKSKCYGHFKRIRVSPKKSSTLDFHSTCL